MILKNLCNLIFDQFEEFIWLFNQFEAFIWLFDHFEEFIWFFNQFEEFIWLFDHLALLRQWMNSFKLPIGLLTIIEDTSHSTTTWTLSSGTDTRMNTVPLWCSDKYDVVVPYRTSLRVLLLSWSISRSSDVVLFSLSINALLGVSRNVPPPNSVIL